MIRNQLRLQDHDNPDPDKWQMMKALAVAVNQAIQEKIQPVNRNNRNSEVNKELYDLLARGNETKKSPKEYFRVALSRELQITSPRVLAEVCLKSNAPQWLVESMIQRQFDIRWRTDSGEPDDYSFYDFCNTEKTKKYFKYKPRRAHVKTTLYKECRSNLKQYKEILDDALRSPKNTLCPEVYFSTINGWKAWQANDEEDNEKDEFREVNFSHEFSKWIDKDILKFIEKYADKQALDDVSLENGKTHPLEKPTLYWAVIKDKDFPRVEMNNLKLKPIGSTQVYVGKANNGIKGRWLDDDSNHCEMMKECLDNVYAMTTYDPMRLEGIQLVDARLALAKVRGEKTALFAIKTFGDDFEKAEIAVQKARNHFDELRKSEGSWLSYNPFKASCDDSDSDASEKSLPARASESLKEARKNLQSAKSFFETLSKDSKTKNDKNDDEVIKKLEDEEGYHRQGIRRKTEERNFYIIPSDKYETTWKPTLMGYGMNFK